MSIQFRFVLPAVFGLVILGLVTYALAASSHAREVEAEVIRRNEVMLAAVDREVGVASDSALQLASIMGAIPAVEAAYQLAAKGNADDERDAHVQAARTQLRSAMERYVRAHARATGTEGLMVHFHLPTRGASYACGATSRCCATASGRMYPTTSRDSGPRWSESTKTMSQRAASSSAGPGSPSAAWRPCGMNTASLSDPSKFSRPSIRCLRGKSQARSAATACS